MSRKEISSAAPVCPSCLSSNTQLVIAIKACAQLQIYECNVCGQSWQMQQPQRRRTGRRTRARAVFYKRRRS